MGGTHHQQVEFTANLHQAHYTKVSTLIPSCRASDELHDGAMDGVEGDRQQLPSRTYPI